MVNKVLGAYVAADFLFVATGAILVGFSVIVQNIMFETPTEGGQAVRNLLYQEFPLTGTLMFPRRKGRTRICDCGQSISTYIQGPDATEGAFMANVSQLASSTAC